MGGGTGVRAEDQRIDAQDAVGADLGHDGEQGGHRRAGVGVGGGQPQVERQQRRLEGEHPEQQQPGRPHQWDVFRRRGGDLDRQIGHVKGAEHAVQGAYREQEQGGAGQIDDHEMQARPGASPPAAMQQQPVGSQQQNLEEHEQVEQVAGEESAVQTKELELEQDVEMPPGASSPRMA